MKQKRTELLAPAGNALSLYAAVSAGADAVYLGLEAFNARRGADNFTLESLESACDYAHLRGVSVYLALNTVVLPGELSFVLETARQAYRRGVDAFIVQDIGLAAEIRKNLPQAALHISTQMNTHSLAGLEAAHALGARRVTLARELSCSELTHLGEHARELGLELETFIHGALCVCYSGQCFMSSMIGGRSANRGLCAQACRLPYTLHNKALRKTLAAEGEHLLSPKDLCALDLLACLQSCGIHSFKIEGRMKSPEYVYTTTSVYRRALDRINATQKRQAFEQDKEVSAQKRFALGQIGQVPEEDRQGFAQDRLALGQIGQTLEEDRQTPEQDRAALAEVFSRGFTTAYLEDKRGNSIMSYGRPNNRGVFVGRVQSARDGKVALAPEEELVPGDILEFWTNKGHFTHEVTELTGDHKNRVSFPLVRAVGKGDRVFRVRRAGAAFTPDPTSPKIALEAKIEIRLGTPLKMQFSIACHNGRSSASFSVGSVGAGDEQAPLVSPLPTWGATQLDSVSITLEGPPAEAARTKAISIQEVRDHIDRMGGTPFVLETIDIDLDEGVGLGFSQLHRLRAEALERLTAVMLEPYRQRILSKLSPSQLQPVYKKSPCKIGVWVTNPACARAAKRAGADLIYAPVLFSKRGQALIAGQISGTVESVSYPKESIMALPVISHDTTTSNPDPGKDSDFKARLLQTRNPDVLQYMLPASPLFVENFGQLVQSAKAGALPEVGPHIPVLNRAALQTLVSLGAVRVWLSPELNLRQIEELAHSTPVPLGLTLIGHQELMTTEHCLLMSQGPCNEDCPNCARRKSPHYLKDRKGYEFPVVTDYCGRSHLFNAVEFDVAHAAPDLIRAGLSAFMVDTTMMTVAETVKAVERAIRARDLAQKSGDKLSKKEGATTGHLFRGIT